MIDPDLPIDTDLEVSFAEDGITFFCWRYLGDGTALLWTYTLGVPPGSTRREPTRIEGV